MRGPSRRRRDRLTVLFATSSLGYTGGEKALADLVENVRAVPWVDAQVLARAGSRFVDRCRDAGCDPVLSDFLTEFGLLNYLRVRRALELTRPDIIHLNGYVGPSFLAAARTEGIPVVQHVRVVDSPAMEEHVRTADAIVAISQFTKSEVLLTGVSSAQRLYLIYNGFSHHDWVATEGERENERRRLELPDESWVVIMVARYVANKRHGLLLRAAHLLRRSVPELRLLLVGDPVLDPSGYESCRGLVQQLELEPITKHVTFAANMRGLYAASDVCVIASTREPFGNSACEAVLSDVPVLACGDGGFLEILRPHGADAIVGDQSPEGLAAALGTLYGRPRMHEDVRAERKEWIAETFSMNRYVESVTAVYRNLIP